MKLSWPMGDIIIVALQLHGPGCVLALWIANRLHPHEWLCVSHDVELLAVQPLAEPLHRLEDGAALVLER
eukprot:1879378-Prymnesium_polylepis.1